MVEIKIKSRAFWSSALGLPIVVARALPFVPIIPRGDAKALHATLLAKE